MYNDFSILSAQTVYASSIPLTTISSPSFILNAANADGYAIRYGGDYSATLDTTGFTQGILAIDTCGCAVLPLNISGGTTLLLGPVVSTMGQGNKLTLNVASGQTVQLTGVAYTTDFYAATNDYSALGAVNFGGGDGVIQAFLSGNSTLNINFQNASNARLTVSGGDLNGGIITITNPSIGTFDTIEFNGYIHLQAANNETTFFTNQWSIGQVDAFTALTPAIFTSPTIGSGFLNVGHLHIGAANTVNTVTIKPTSNVDVNGSGMYEAYRGNTKHYGTAGQPDSTNLGYSSGIFISRIFWENADAELVLDSSNSNADLAFDTPGSNLVNGVGINAATWGILTLNAQNHSLTVTSTSTIAGQTLRPKLITGAALKTLNINVNRNVTLDLEGYVGTINFNNPAPQILFATPATP